MKISAAANGDRKHSTIPLLPQAIEEEILSRLPVKSLIRLRCISKSWRSLIDSKRFITNHLQNSTKNINLPNRKVLYINDCKNIFRSYESASELNFLSNIPLSLSFVGCCNGLVCVLLKGFGIGTEKFIMWNPSTGITKKLPSLGEDTIRYGFGWDGSRDDYKVVAIVSHEAPPTCHMYSLKADSWTTTIKGFGHFPRARPKPAAILASGKLHWERNYWYKPDEWEIVCFDLKREVFGMVEQPCYNNEGGLELSLGKFGDFLAVVATYNYRNDIWVMKEYGVKESWVKVVVVSHYYCPLWISPSMASLFSDEEGDDILLERMDRNYHVFNVKKTSFQNLGLSCESAIYIESLVSPLV